MGFLGLNNVNDPKPSDSNTEPEGKGVPNKTLYAIRAIIGAYLFYIDYQLIGPVAEKTGAEQIAMIAVMVLFAIAGLVLIGLSAWKIIKQDGGGNA